MPTSKAKPALLKRGFKAEAERIALHYRQSLGIPPHDPLPARRLADLLGIRIIEPAEIPGITHDLLELLLVKGKDCWSAAFYIKDGKKFVIHNPTHAPCRQESNLMHELAHAHCNHGLGEQDNSMIGHGLPLRQYNPEQEAEADCLGACLQLPKEALIHYHNKLKKSPPEIARIFNACKPMVNFRLRLSGALKIISWKR